MSDCLFCKIIEGSIPAEIVYQDEHVIGFNDIAPQAPTHILFIPRQHVSTINDFSDGDTELMGLLIQAARKTATAQNFAGEGYRLVFNCNAHGGQTVFHVHLHLLAGRAMHWPPG